MPKKTKRPCVTMLKTWRKNMTGKTLLCNFKEIFEEIVKK